MRSNGGIASAKLAASLLADQSARLSLVVAACIGLAYAISQFGIAGVLGTAPLWELPSLGAGEPDAGSLDLRNTLSGFSWFRQEPWGWPLLAVHNPNWPAGTNAELFDIAPWFAILGKLTYRIFSWPSNPYPFWLTSCMVLNGVALATLVRAMGSRSLIAAILAGAFGVLAPVLHLRLTAGHMGLMAHWVPIFALALYFHAVRRGYQWRTATGAIALCFLAVGIHLYLYVMTAAVLTALILQWVLDRSCSPLRGILLVMALVLAGVVPLWAFGFFADASLFHVTGVIGRYSMNLMSPFWPQWSGLLRWTGIFWFTRGVIGAHPGQGDGFFYLGGGVLLLLVLALWVRRHDIWSGLRSHLGLVAAFLVLTFWALSNEIDFGPYAILTYDPPQIMKDTVLAWFRSGGRMFWPVGWFLVAFAVVQATTRFSPSRTLGLTMLALVLQWVDSSPLRSSIRSSFSAPVASAFGSADDRERISRRIAEIGQVAVIPAIFCSSAGANYSSPLNLAAMEVQLMAARANAKMRLVYLSRTENDCTKRPLPGEASVLVFVKDAGTPIDTSTIPGSADCFELQTATVCTTKG